MLFSLLKNYTQFYLKMWLQFIYWRNVTFKTKILLKWIMCFTKTNWWIMMKISLYWEPKVSMNQSNMNRLLNYWKKRSKTAPTIQNNWEKSSLCLVNVTKFWKIKKKQRCTSRTVSIYNLTASELYRTWFKSTNLKLPIWVNTLRD